MQVQVRYGWSGATLAGMRGEVQFHRVIIKIQQVL